MLAKCILWCVIRNEKGRGEFSRNTRQAQTIQAVFFVSAQLLSLSRQSLTPGSRTAVALSHSCHALVPAGSLLRMRATLACHISHVTLYRLGLGVMVTSPTSHVLHAIKQAKKGVAFRQAPRRSIISTLKATQTPPPCSLSPSPHPVACCNDPVWLAKQHCKSHCEARCL